MPVIPTDAGSQILNAGSPVPVASTEDERAFGNALAYLGEGLARVGKQVNDSRDKYVSDIAADKYNKRLLQEYARQQQEAPIEGDTTGLGAAKAIQDRAFTFKQEMLDTFENEDQKLMFNSKSGNFENDIMSTAFANEVKKRAQYNEQLLTKSMMSKADMLRVDPSLTTTVLSDIAASVELDRNIPDAKKLEATKKFQQMALNESVQGLIDNGEFDAALVLATPLSAQLYTSEEREKYLNEIKSAQVKAIDRQWQIDTKQGQLLKTHKEEMRQKAIDYYMKAKEVAGADSAVNAQVDAEILNSPNLRGEDKDNLVKVGRVFSKAMDDMFESKIITRAIIGEDKGNINKLIQEVTAAEGTSFSIDRAIPLKTRLLQMQNEFSKDPAFKVKLHGGLKIIRAHGKDNLAELTSFTARELEIMLGMAEINFSKRLQGNLHGDTEAMANAAIADVFGPKRSIKLRKGVMPQDQPTSIPVIDKRLEKLHQESKKSGLTSARKQQIYNEAKQLLRDKSKLEGEKKNATAPGTGPAAGTKNFAPAKR